MIPEHFAPLKFEFRYITLLGFQERVVGLSTIRIRMLGTYSGFPGSLYPGRIKIF